MWQSTDGPVAQLRTVVTVTEGACQDPECEDEVVETYHDANGNQLELCAEHYFDAVYPGVRAVSLTSREKDSERSLLDIFR